jgi:hypothetical protein
VLYPISLHAATTTTNLERRYIVEPGQHHKKRVSEGSKRGKNEVKEL